MMTQQGDQIRDFDIKPIPFTGTSITGTVGQTSGFINCNITMGKYLVDSIFNIKMFLNAFLAVNSVCVRQDLLSIISSISVTWDAEQRYNVPFAPLLQRLWYTMYEHQKSDKLYIVTSDVSLEKKYYEDLGIGDADAAENIHYKNFSLRHILAFLFDKDEDVFEVKSQFNISIKIDTAMLANLRTLNGNNNVVAQRANNNTDAYTFTLLMKQLVNNVNIEQFPKRYVIQQATINQKNSISNFQLLPNQLSLYHGVQIKTTTVNAPELITNNALTNASTGQTCLITRNNQKLIQSVNKTDAIQQFNLCNKLKTSSNDMCALWDYQASNTTLITNVTLGSEHDIYTCLVYIQK